jgi:5-formyltetrahydrofolate cyclo-ligase
VLMDRRLSGGPVPHTGEMGGPGGDDGVTAAKTALRAQVRRARAGAADVSDALCRTACDAAPVRDLLRRGRGTVLAYAALPGEPDLAPLRSRLRDAGVRVVLPVLTGPGTMAWAPDTGRLAPGRPLPGGLRLPEPDPADAVPLGDLGLGRQDLVLVPALAVGRDGTRLGQGGGYYDRALAILPRHPSGPLLVAVVREEELLAAGAVPAHPHDLRVDAVLTPAGWTAARTARAAPG